MTQVRGFWVAPYLGSEVDDKRRVLSEVMQLLGDGTIPVHSGAPSLPSRPWCGAAMLRLPSRHRAHQSPGLIMLDRRASRRIPAAAADLVQRQAAAC